jgi:hypothetical protein
MSDPKAVEYPLVCGGCGAVLTIPDLDDPHRRPAGHTVGVMFPDLCGPVVRRACFIDGCRRPAVLVALTYPDTTSLCADHQDIYEADEWNPSKVVWL